MDAGLVAGLRAALDAADYRVDAVAERLGPLAHDALARNETTPGIRATGSGDRLDTLIRLWLLQAPVPVSVAESALPGLVDRLCVHQVLERSVGEVAARIDVRPYATDTPTDAGGTGDLWVASDLTPGLDGSPNRVGTDHVLGISSASTSLAQLTVRDRVERALDLGTGCGVQALHLAGHAGTVVATDVNPRALWITELNLALNEVDNVQVRSGSLYQPVAGEEFDLIATNPPFVISPGTAERLVYRDSGLPGDTVVERVVAEGRRHLAPGGLLQVLANWAVIEGREWAERLAEWAGDCDSFVVQREVMDPAAYVELWLRDAGICGGPEYLRRYDTWLSWFAEQQITGIGFGWINVRRPDGPGAAVSHQALDWPYAVEQPVAPALAEHFALLDADRGLDSPQALRQARLIRPVDVVQETTGTPGAEDPEHIVLRRQRGLRRALPVDTATAAVVGACDGDLTIGQILDALERLGVDTADATDRIRECLREGFLQPA